jgi:hypothetical protein
MLIGGRKRDVIANQPIKSLTALFIDSEKTSIYGNSFERIGRTL